MTVHELKGKTIALAASGGLDSCTICRWLTDQGVTVISVTADIGQPDETEITDVKERMLACGAEEAVVVDLKRELVEEAVTLLIAGAPLRGGILEYDRNRTPRNHAGYPPGIGRARDLGIGPRGDGTRKRSGPFSAGGEHDRSFGSSLRPLERRCLPGVLRRTP